MTQLSWRATSRLSVSGPPGWSPVDRVDVHHQAGDALVRVESWMVEPDADLDQLAEAHAEHALPDGVENAQVTTAELLGTPARRRTVSWTDAGDARAATLLHALRGRRMVAVTQVVPAVNAGRLQEAEAIVASLSLSEPLDLPEELLPLRPGEGVDLAEVARTWRNGAACAPTPTHVITTEESFAAAGHYGVAMLPGADVGRWGALQPWERDLVAATAWRSLEARETSGEPGLRECLELAASHDLIVVVATGEDGRRTVEWFAARVDRMARLRPSEHGRVRVTVHDTAELADLLLADLLQAADPAVPGTASVVRRHRGAVVGQEAAWSATATDREIRDALASLLAMPARDEVKA